jgi:hypothetical protein
VMSVKCIHRAARDAWLTMASSSPFRKGVRRIAGNDGRGRNGSSLSRSHDGLTGKSSVRMGFEVSMAGMITILILVERNPRGRRVADSRWSHAT